MRLSIFQTWFNSSKTPINGKYIFVIEDEGFIKKKFSYSFMKIFVWTVITFYFTTRLLANYMIWRIMMNRVTNLPLKYRNVRTEYYKVRVVFLLTFGTSAL